jgi:hypothetical protein
MMAVKLLAEAECKEIAVKMGIEIFVSVDLDEYLFPSIDSMTVMDQLANWFNVTTRGYMHIAKLNFPSIPHLQVVEYISYSTSCETVIPNPIFPLIQSPVVFHRS